MIAGIFALGMGCIHKKLSIFEFLFLFVDIKSVIDSIHRNTGYNDRPAIVLTNLFILSQFDTLRIMGLEIKLQIIGI